MTVNVSKPAINVREKLAELDKPTGIAGEAMLRAETVPDQAELLGYRQQNVIINGGMNVWQRGTSDDTAANGDYTTDRWSLTFSGLDGNVDWDRETSSTPEGFGSALKISTDASETSLDSGDQLFFQQRIEGQNAQHFKKGTSEALPYTLSFWVRSSVASTYTIEFKDQDNGRAIGRTYSINQADTWEYKTLVFSPDTTGELDNDNGDSLRVLFWIDAGSGFTSGTFSTSWQTQATNERVYNTTGWLESTSPTFYITGVQLVAGNYPDGLPFMHRSYGEELALCQRYYQRLTAATNNAAICTTSLWTSGTSCYGVLHLPTELRTAPTVSFSGTFVVFSGGSTTNVTSSGGGSNFNGNSVELVFNHNAIGSAGNSAWIRMGSTGNYVGLDAEL